MTKATETTTEITQIVSDNTNQNQHKANIIDNSQHENTTTNDTKLSEEFKEQNENGGKSNYINDSSQCVENVNKNGKVSNQTEERENQQTERRT
jgi:hypothetical protein